MKKTFNRGISMLLALIMLLSSAVSNVAFAADTTQTPQQIALALTSDPQTSISINWTTIDTSLTGAKVKIWESGADESTAFTRDAATEKRTVASSTIKDSSDQPVTEKNFYSVTVDGLTPDTEYNYRLGTDAVMSGVKSFKTAQDDTGEFSFIYVSDSQVDGSHAKGWNANLDIMKQKYPNAKFIYIAGDLTNTAANEGQWESFFNQPGNAQYNEKFSGSFISEIPTVAAMGNHDAGGGGAGGMSSHYTWGSEADGVPVSYAFDYGAARFIILNLENAYSMNNETTRTKQEEFLRKEVDEAKQDGKWVIVGFHKSLYSGANHMDDSDVINNRKYWAPIFAEIGVDTVLQGHDHVLSRGFIQPDGYKLDIVGGSNRVYTATAPQNTPLYYTGNTGSTLKFYAPLPNNDWIKEGDPVAPDFGYLDLNSALPAGHALNPLGPCTNDDLEATDPSFYRTPTFTVVTVSEGAMTYETYMTGFNQATNTVTKDTFLYDSLTVTRADVNLTLKADKNEISADSSVELNLTAKDKLGADIDITTGAAIVYKADKDGILSIVTTVAGMTTGGAIVTVENLPEADETVTVYAEVTIGEEIYKSNPVKIKVLVPLVLTINNPYESVDWTTYGQYKADFHTHSTNSDGGNLTSEMAEDHYTKGYDILAMTDHNYLSKGWDTVDKGAMTTARKAEIEAGTGRSGKGMIDVTYSDEQSVSDHLNTFFTDFNNASGATLESNIAKAHELGGISHINHAGRYTKAYNTVLNNTPEGDAAGIAVSKDPVVVKKYVDLFNKYSSLIGMEIINKIDNESAADRVLWDSILTKTMPGGRFVWGFSNDDTHSLNATGYSWNMMLMPSLSSQNTRTAMETGTFYAVSRVSRLDNINEYLQDGATPMPGSGNSNTTYLLAQKTPSISNIAVDEAKDTITITGADYNTIEWIANGNVIATGATIDLNDYEDKITSYVRAQLKSSTGIAFTQPFGVEGLESVPVLDSAELKADGNKILTGSSNKVKLSVVAKDQFGSPISTQDLTVAYKSDKTDILDISAAGTVTVKTVPVRNQEVKIYAEVSDAAGKVITNKVSITVALPEFEAADGHIATAIKTANDDVEEFVSSGEMYLDSSDLEIVWESPDKSDKDEQLIGLRFTELAIPRGAKILDAYIEFTVDEPDKSTDPFDVNIHAEAVNDSQAFTTTAHDVSSRTLTQNTVNWKDIPLWVNDGSSGIDQQTPNLASVIQEVIDIDGWKENNAMTFVIGGTGNRSAKAFETSASAAPRLYVTYITSPNEIKLAVPIKTAADDMEESADGSLDDGSSDLEIMEEKSIQVIGLRFQDINVPKGAKITSAYVQFTVDEADKSKDPFNVAIQAEDTLSSAPFNPAVKFDVSGRARTQTSVAWKDIPMWTVDQVAGEDQRTSDIASLIQELIDKDGWESGNAISLILSGVGIRVAEAYEGAKNEGERPTLNLVYSLGDEEPETLTLTPGKNTGEINVTWYSDDTGGNGKVKFGDKTVDAISGAATTGTNNGSKKWHKATITGLTPNKVYTYSVSNDGTDFSNEYTYKTPGTGEFTFAAVGDPQLTAGLQDSTSNLFSSDKTTRNGWADTVKAINDKLGNKLNFIAGVGDQVDLTNVPDAASVDKSETEYNNFFAPNLLRSIPFAPAVGNHDRHYGFTYHYNLPNEQNFDKLQGADYGNASNNQYADVEAKGNYYYTYNNALFVVLNDSAYPTSKAAAGEIIKRFEATLKAAVTSNSNYNWLFVQHHKSTASVADHVADRDIQYYVEAGFEKLMDKYAADFVLAGHDHVYARSYPMKDGKRGDNQNGSAVKNPNGTIYLTFTTGSGLKYYELFNAAGNLYVKDNADYPYLANGLKGSVEYMKGILPLSTAKQLQAKKPAFTSINVKANSVTFETYNIDDLNNSIDTFTVTKQTEQPEKPEKDNSGGGSKTPETPKAPEAPKAPAFSDITDGFWAKQEIEYLASNGIILGRGAGQFEPQGIVTRAEFAKLITAVLSLDNSNAGNAFADVNTSDWYSGYISSAVRAGIINGYSDGTFKPNSSISRLEMAVIAGRALKLKGYKVSEDSEQYLAFNDKNLISYGQDEIALAVQYGIINGKPGNILDPGGISTRAEAAAIIYRLFTFLGI